MTETSSNIVNKLDDVLLDIIVCPVDKQVLAYTYLDSVDMPILVNFRLKKYYEIIESIPILLEEESKVIEDKDIEKLKKNTIRTTGSR
jgi:uncharacterized protein YbaR (Trm112 family)